MIAGVMDGSQMTCGLPDNPQTGDFEWKTIER